MEKEMERLSSSLIDMGNTLGREMYRASRTMRLRALGIDDQPLNSLREHVLKEFPNGIDVGIDFSQFEQHLDEVLEKYCQADIDSMRKMMSLMPYEMDNDERNELRKQSWNELRKRATRKRGQGKW